MFVAPFRFEWKDDSGMDSTCIVLDAEDDVIATCITDIHAQAVCDAMNAQHICVTTGAQPATWVYPKCPHCGARHNPTLNGTC